MRQFVIRSVLSFGLVASAGLANAADEMPGPIDSLDDVQDTGKIIFKLADANNDGQISQKEATDTGNLMVGGFFFGADANGDGTLSKEEAQSAREAFMNQRPFLRLVFDRAKAPGGTPAATQGNKNPIMGLANLLDGNNDKQLQASELRQAVQSAVQGLYAAADTNRDNQMSPSEINAGVAGLARSIAQASFQAADADNNGTLSQGEFEKSLVEPSKIVFKVLDGNGDGQIAPDETKAAENVIMSQLRGLRVAEPANSPRRMIESGNAQPGNAPVPTFTAPGRPPRAPNPNPNPNPNPAPAPRQPQQ